MTNDTRTIVRGYDKDNKIVAIRITDYEHRFEAVNEIANLPNVEYTTTKTVLRH